MNKLASRLWDAILRLFSSFPVRSSVHQHARLEPLLPSSIPNAAVGELPWDIEDIPDADALYMRIHNADIDADGEPMPRAFRLRKDKDGVPEAGMSTDWNKYSTAEQSRQRARVPNDNAIISMNVGDVRSIPDQKVEHKPIPENRSHSEISGVKSTEARARYMTIYILVIPLTREQDV